MKLSIIIASWNTRELLEQCLAGVYRFLSSLAPEVIVVDNGSCDGSAALVRERFPRTMLIENKENSGPVKANNQGAAISHGEYLLFMNTDVFLFDSSLEDMVRYLDDNPAIGVVGPQLLDAEGEMQPSSYAFPAVRDEAYKNFYFLLKLLSAGRPVASAELSAPCLVDWVPTACFLVRRDVYQALDGFDEYFFMYCDDVDFCHRLRKKTPYRVLFHPLAQAVHVGGASTPGAEDEKLKNIQVLKMMLGNWHHYFRKNRGWMIWLVVKKIEIAASVIRILVAMIRLCNLYKIRHKLLIARYELYKIKFNIFG